jgi:glutamine amidotransferase
MIGIIDYGAGNIRSIKNAFTLLDKKVTIVPEPNDLKNFDALVLPGVGNFGSAMEGLEKFRPEIREAIDGGIPFLGVCLGIQIILDSSEESPGTKGLGILEGKCVRFPRDIKTPHMGWNTLDIKRDIGLLDGITAGDFFYFVHSYYAVPEEDGVIAATSTYEKEFPAVIAKDNVFATQFHPEKSGEPGLRILRNFLEAL